MTKMSVFILDGFIARRRMRKFRRLTPYCSPMGFRKWARLRLREESAYRLLPRVFTISEGAIRSITPLRAGRNKKKAATRFLVWRPMVEGRGIEPLTYRLPACRSPS